MSSPKSSANLAHWIILIISAFMAIIGFLGFLGWWSDPSNQKWWALFCSFVGVAGVILFWNSDEISDEEIASVTDGDEEIKLKSVEEQRRYWKQELRGDIIGLLIISVVFVFLCVIWEALREYSFLVVTFWLTGLWRLLKVARELGNLPRE